jgi:hypothetical protein
MNGIPAQDTRDPSQNRRWWRGGLLFIGGIFFSIPIAVAVLYCRPCGVTDYLIGSMYRNVDPPADLEMPVTVSGYPSSPQTVAIIGGRGEGLNCSIPVFAQWLFPRFTLLGKTSPVTRRFHQACVFHDLCYRHGLATYGYSQADCDTMLREQAVRLCAYLSPRKTAQDCQLDAKKVLAGVAFFGYEAYRNWNESSFYEFDPNPARAERFAVSRAINHPFAAAPVKDDPRQWILTFDIKRSGTEVTCANCVRRNFTPDEFKEAGIELNAAGMQPIQPTAARTDSEPLVYLPPRTGVSAPYLMTRPDGRQSFAWLNRLEIHNTNLCQVIADPKHLLTQTRYQGAGCGRGASRRMHLSSTDLYSVTPQIFADAVPAAGAAEQAVYSAGLSPQKADHVAKCSERRASLRLYKSFDISKGREWTDSGADCLRDRNGQSIGDYGMFQYPPIIRKNRNVFLSRSLVRLDASGAGQGADPAHDLRVTAFDVNFNRGGEDNIAFLDRVISVPDLFDMMVPVSRRKDDYRVLSLVAPPLRAIKRGEDKLAIHEINLSSDTAPTPRLVFADADGLEIFLHYSWARRPVHVVETPQAGQAAAATELVLSRSRISRAPGTVVFEFAVLRRDRDGGKAFTLARSARCAVRYAADSRMPSCRRTAPADLHPREGLQSKLQGTQLLVGHFSRASEIAPEAPFDLALVDRCARQRPILLRANGARFTAADDAGSAVGRTTTCEGALDRRMLAADIVDLKAAATTP